MHNKKNYKHAPNDAINARVTASFILSLTEVGLTPYLLHRNIQSEDTTDRRQGSEYNIFTQGNLQ